MVQVKTSLDKRIHRPKQIRNIKSHCIKYSNAEQMAKEIKIKKNERYFTFTSGNYIFGDFIEAFCAENDFFIKHMIISTLSMSGENIDSLKNLLVDKYVNKLSLIVSDYFYGHERGKLMKYIYQELDIDNRFQLAVARSHTKICIFETYNNQKFVIHGSANLRSSDNIEQFDIEENEQLFDYIYEFHEKIIKEYQTVNKSIGGQKLWQVLEKVDQVKKEENEPQQQKEEDVSQQEEKGHRSDFKF